MVAPPAARLETDPQPVKSSFSGGLTSPQRVRPIPSDLPEPGGGSSTILTSLQPLLKCKGIERIIADITCRPNVYNGTMQPADQSHAHPGRSRSVFSFIVGTDNSTNLADERSGQIQFRFVHREYPVSAPEFAGIGSLFKDAGMESFKHLLGVCGLIPQLDQGDCVMPAFATPDVKTNNMISRICSIYRCFCQMWTVPG